MSTSAPAPPEQDVTASSVVEQEDRPSLQMAVRKLAQGELGPLRVLIVLAIIWVIFGIANSSFLTAINLTNLALQFTGLGMISVGVVLVLLLGEIDLSVGAVSGVCASIVAVLNVKNGWNPYLAMLAGLLAGAIIGFLQGSIATRFEIPSFVVPLAGLLVWQGVQLKVLGETGTVNINDAAITNLAGSFLADWLGWVVAIAAAAAIALTTLARRRRRAAAALELQPVPTMVISIVAPIIAIVVAVYVVNQDRGVPLSLLILVGAVVLFAFVTTRLPYGRHIYAVGGNAEAARRAGIAVPWIRTSVFVLASTLAAAGGILLAARLLAVNQASGGSDLLLNAIAGPVIAGVSLFGGRGSVWAALLGALVIQSISNGMDLLGLESSVKFIVTGGVLIGAVMLDAISRGRRRAVGRV
jgi:D-xylose transport system permease protein